MTFELLADARTEIDGAASLLTDVLGVAVSPPPTFPAVLDACCGGRMFWWNKTNKDALFMDCREVEKGAFQNGWNPGWCVKPDEIADFRDMPFPDNTFNMVVFDPPHLTSGSMKSVINKKYGLLNKDTWKADIVAGFSECWRVLAPGGVLIFKWNEANIKAKDLLRSFPAEPLFGDFTGKTGSTIWVTYMKTPNAPHEGRTAALSPGVPLDAVVRGGA